MLTECFVSRILQPRVNICCDKNEEDSLCGDSHLNLYILSVVYHSPVVTQFVTQVGRHEQDISPKLKIVVAVTV